jgi:hypothetical protein
MSETKTMKESLSHFVIFYLPALPIAQPRPWIIHQPSFTFQRVVVVRCSRVQPFLYEHQEVN